MNGDSQRQTGHSRMFISKPFPADTKGINEKRFGRFVDGWIEVAAFVGSKKCSSSPLK